MNSKMLRLPQKIIAAVAAVGLVWVNLVLKPNADSLLGTAFWQYNGGNAAVEANCMSVEKNSGAYFGDFFWSDICSGFWSVRVFFGKYGCLCGERL